MFEKMGGAWRKTRLFFVETFWIDRIDDFYELKIKKKIPKTQKKRKDMSPKKDSSR